MPYKEQNYPTIASDIRCSYSIRSITFLSTLFYNKNQYSLFRVNEVHTHIQQSFFFIFSSLDFDALPEINDSEAKNNYLNVIPVSHTLKTFNFAWISDHV